MEACGNENLYAPISSAQPGPGTQDSGDPKSGPLAPNGDDRGRHRKNPGLRNPLSQETSWNVIKGWYKAAPDRAPPPVQLTIKRIMVKRIALYQRVLPPGENILMSVTPFIIYESMGIQVYAIQPLWVQLRYESREPPVVVEGGPESGGSGNGGGDRGVDINKAMDKDPPDLYNWKKVV